MQIPIRTEIQNRRIFSQENGRILIKECIYIFRDEVTCMPAACFLF